MILTDSKAFSFVFEEFTFGKISFGGTPNLIVISAPKSYSFYQFLS